MHSTQRISDDELENYNKYNEIIDDLDYQLEQLEKDGIDVFDLRLELKLSQDKVKSGSFNMVNIYLDGLKPRIKAFWDKLGKQPKKREIKLISESELGEELEKAKQERKKYAEESGKIQEESNKEENQNIEKAIDDLTDQIKNFVGNDDKQGAISLYSKVQEIYKNTPKEQKAKILSKCIQIQKILSEK